MRNIIWLQILNECEKNNKIFIITLIHQAISVTYLSSIQDQNFFDKN